MGSELDWLDKMLSGLHVGSTTLLAGIPSGGKTVTTDHVNVYIKGPASNLTVEVFYARDAARTPLLFKVPVSLGTVSLELVRH